MNKFFFSILLLGILYSCQDQEYEFSCDPEINEFVTKNEDELSQISVKDLVTYELPLQKAVFASWDPQKKRDAWIGKLEKVIASDTLTQEGAAHIRKLISHIRTGYFEAENLQKDGDANILFADEWLDKAKNNLGWTDQFIAFLVYRLYTESYQFETELSELRAFRTKSSAGSESSGCDCNTSSDYCGSYSCSSGGCSVSSGCGWLWSGSCNGTCN